MNEREKVIKAFEFCLMPPSREELENDICSHEDCPYYREYNGGKCMSAAVSDALALLKAQEPRVMAYEELSTIDGAFIIESSAVHPLEWVFFFDTDAGSDAVWVQGFDGERNIICREDYGIYVRCWTYRPDQATREATSWDAQEQRDYEAAVEMAEYCERYEPTYNADDGSM
jgi:hypothetical protein